MSEEDGLIGTVVAGRYEIVERLGAGGMGVVYRARQIAMNRFVALKLLHAHYSTNKNAAARFEREMQATARIEHPSTIRVYDYGATDSGQLFLAMELVQGKTLAEILRAEGRLPVPRQLRIAQQIARALVAAHAEGVVHRDLKLDNVMLVDLYGETDIVKVVDFGIARFIESGQDQQLTAEGAVIGTPAYMAPEQVQGRPPDPRTDLYALGIILFEMATGAVPFEAPTTLSLLVKHVQEPPPRPSTRADLPIALEQLILQCLEKEPAARPANATEVLRRLESLTLPSSPAPSRRRLLWGVAALVALGLGGLGVYLATASKPERIAVAPAPAPDPAPDPAPTPMPAPAPTPAPTPAPAPDPRAALAAIFAEAQEPDVPESCKTREPPGTVEVLARAGRLLAGADHPAAYDHLMKYRDLIAGSVEGQVFLARATLGAVQTPGEAEPAALAAVKLCDCALAHDVLGDVHRAEEKLDAAAGDWLSASQREPDWFVPLAKAVDLELARERPDRALELLADILRRRPDHLPAMSYAVEAYLQKDQAQPALDLLERMTRLAPDDPGLWSTLAKVRRAIGLVDGADVADCKAKALEEHRPIAACDAPAAP